MDMNKVLYNVDQREDTTAEQKKTAMDNNYSGTEKQDVHLLQRQQRVL